jgi:hypothetical protein
VDRTAAGVDGQDRRGAAVQGFLYKEYQQLRVRNKTHPPTRPEDVVDIAHYTI